MENNDKVLDTAEVAERFGVDPKTVTRWADAKKLKHFRTLGGHRRFYESDIKAAIKVIQAAAYAK